MIVLCLCDENLIYSLLSSLTWPFHVSGIRPSNVTLQFCHHSALIGFPFPFSRQLQYLEFVFGADYFQFPNCVLSKFDNLFEFSFDKLKKPQYIRLNDHLDWITDFSHPVELID